MKRKTRFSPGGLNPFQGGDVDPFSAARDDEGGIAQAKGRDLKSEIEGMQGMYDKEDWEQKGPSTQAAKPMSFKEAFANARKRGESTFTWNGDKYTTEVGSPKAASQKARANEDYGNESRRKVMPPIKTKADDRARTKELNKTGGLDERMPLSRGIKAAGDFFKRNVSDRYTGLGGNYNTPEARAKGLEVIAKQIRDRREKDQGYAKGGSVSSASSRGDGCAQRGKTRGKMV